MLTAFVIDAVFLHPVPQTLRSRKNANAPALTQAIACFGTDNARVTVESLFDNRAVGNPQFSDLGAPITLVRLDVPQPEEFSEPLTVVVIEVRDAHGVVVIALGP